MNIPFETIVAVVLLELYRGLASPAAAEAPSGAAGLLGLTAYLAATTALAWSSLRRLAEDVKASGGPTPELAEEHRLRAIRQKVAVVALYGALLYLFDWPSFVVHTLGVPRHVILDDVLALAPYLAAVALAYVPAHRADGILVRRSWGLAEYIKFNLRYSQATVLAPWLVLKVLEDSAAMLPARLRDYVESSEAFGYVTLAGTIAAAVVLFPWLLKLILHCEPMPPGSVRDRLLAVCAKAGVPCREIYVWRMGSSGVMNAGVIGLVPQYRYILLTESLLENLLDDEVEAVLAHELGHVRHRHTLFNLVFTAAFALLVANVLALFPEELSEQPLFAAPIVVLMLVLYWRFVFGSVSRRYERQADLAAAEFMGTPVPIIMSLEKIALFSGDTRRARNLRHGSVADRSRFLFRNGFDRRMIDEYHGEIRWMSWGLVAASALILAQTVRADLGSPGPAGDEETAQAFVQKKPDDAEGWYALGRARARRGKVEQAALAFATAIELVPTHSRAERDLRALKLELGAAELHLGRAYYNAGWWTRSEQSYAKAVEANPRSAAAHAGLAQVYLRPGPGGPYDPKKALEHARLAAELSPAPSAARLSLLAGACFANGLVDEAIDHCRRARDLEPENLGIRQQLEEYLNSRRSPGPYL